MCFYLLFTHIIHYVSRYLLLRQQFRAYNLSEDITTEKHDDKKYVKHQIHVCFAFIEMELLSTPFVQGVGYST